MRSTEPHWLSQTWNPGLIQNRCSFGPCPCAHLLGKGSPKRDANHMSRLPRYTIQEFTELASGDPGFKLGQDDYNLICLITGRCAKHYAREGLGPALRLGGRESSR